MDPVVTVTIPHGLGKTEAARRIKAAIDDARTSYAAKFKVAEENWDGDRLTFRIAVLGQVITGTIDVADDNVRGEIKMNWLMAHLVKPAEAFMKEAGERALA
jgi:hypothetical protein